MEEVKHQHLQPADWVTRVEVEAVKHYCYSAGFMVCSGGEEIFKVLPGDQQCATQKQTHAVLKRRNWLICLRVCVTVCALKLAV